MAEVQTLTSGDFSPEQFSRILSSAIQNKASDLHLRAGKPIVLRIDGELRELKTPPLNAENMENIAKWLCAAAGIPEPGKNDKQMDFSFEVKGSGRFRSHIFSQLGTWAATLRIIPEEVPSPKELRLPPVINQITQLERGLVLVCGATGMGKSTTVASILSEMAKARRCHIVTIEDPVEFVIPTNLAVVSQRSVGVDVDSFDSALEASFREDPDVLFIGEIRTPLSLEVALQAGESGHLCVSTMHTADVNRTIARIGSMVPEDMRRTILGRLAESLQVVISQRLLPQIGKAGRILAAEVMVTSPSLKETIRDPAAHKNLTTVIGREATGTNNNTLDQHLTWLVKNKLISMETAAAAATNPSDLVRSLRLA